MAHRRHPRHQRGHVLEAARWSGRSSGALRRRGHASSSSYYWLADRSCSSLAFLDVPGHHRAAGPRRSLIAIRDNETAAAVMGVNPHAHQDARCSGSPRRSRAAAGSVHRAHRVSANPSNRRAVPLADAIALPADHVPRRRDLALGPDRQQSRGVRRAGERGLGRGHRQRGRRGPAALFGWANQSPATDPGRRDHRRRVRRPLRYRRACSSNWPARSSSSCPPAGHGNAGIARFHGRCRSQATT